MAVSVTTIANAAIALTIGIALLIGFKNSSALTTTQSEISVLEGSIQSLKRQLSAFEDKLHDMESSSNQFTLDLRKIGDEVPTVKSKLDNAIIKFESMVSGNTIKIDGLTQIVDESISKEESNENIVATDAEVKTVVERVDKLNITLKAVKTHQDGLVEQIDALHKAFLQLKGNGKPTAHDLQSKLSSHPPIQRPSPPGLLLGRPSSKKLPTTSASTLPPKPDATDPEPEPIPTITGGKSAKNPTKPDIATQPTQPNSKPGSFTDPSTSNDDTSSSNDAAEEAPAEESESTDDGTNTNNNDSDKNDDNKTTDNTHSTDKNNNKNKRPPKTDEFEEIDFGEDKWTNDD